MSNFIFPEFKSNNYKLLNFDINIQSFFLNVNSHSNKDLFINNLE